jgi:PAS domain S-box-containing protein
MSDAPSLPAWLPAERRRVEDALRETEHRLNEAQALAHVGSWAWDLVTDRLAWSDEHYRIFGLDPREVPIAYPAVLRYVHPDDRAMIEALVARALKDARPYHCEFRVVHPDGTERIVEAHGKLDVDGAGRPIRMFGTSQDVTERREAEALLRQRAQQQAAVAQLGDVALAGGPLDALFEHSVALVAETLNVEYCTVDELLAENRCLLLRAGVGWREGIVGRATTPVGPESQAGFTLLVGGPVVVYDLRTETRFTSPALLTEHGIVAGMSVVIGTPERPFGVLAAHTTAQRVFTADDVNFLQAAAHLLAVAVARRRGEEARQHLLGRAISAQEEERRRVALELHDETGQALSAILVGLRTAEEATTVEDARLVIRRLRDLAGQTLRDVGRLARGLRPSVLDDLGLIPALHHLADEMAAMGGPEVRIRGDPGDGVGPAVQTTMYRILQEALRNVLRHARARAATVAVSREDGVVRAVVEDDGVGFDAAAALARAGRRQSLGLMGMQERAALVGGSVAIESRLGAGTKVTVSLPLG